MSPAAGVRIDYAAAPRFVRAWVARELADPVVEARTQTGGFSPGVAARLLTSSGRRAFVKAVGPELNPKTPELFRLERTAMEALPPSRHAPRLLAAYDDGRWVALLLEDIDGRMPGQPWSVADVKLVFAAVAELSETLHPSPWPAAPRAEVKSASFLSRWPLVQEAAPSHLDPWVHRHLDALVALGEQSLVAISGETLTHWDIRSDNVLITDQGRVVFVDWAHACLAARWVDAVIAACDVAERTSIDVDDVLMRSPVVAAADPDHVTAFVAAVIGGLTWAGAQPDPPGLPTIRVWQQQEALRLLGLLRRRTGWS